MVSGLNATTRNLGQTIGVAIGGAMMDTRQRLYFDRAVEAGAEIPDGSVFYTMAQRDTYYFGTFVIAIAIFCMIMIRPKKAAKELNS